MAFFQECKCMHVSRRPTRAVDGLLSHNATTKAESRPSYVSAASVTGPGR